MKLKNKVNDKSILFQEGREINNLLNRELQDLAIFLQRKIEKDKSLGSYFNSKLNKLIIISLAKEIALIIPHTYIISNKIELSEKLSNKNIITKAISDGLYYFSESYAYYTYTEKICEANVKNINDFSFPSLIQEQIEKEIEIRSFYIKGRFYSMAIISQSNKKTEIDYRKYDMENPNKMLPYKLPKIIEEKLEKLFNLINLNTGSVDLILDKNGKYIFLEINPVGQFTMTSRPCNYSLEKIVAEELIKIKESNEIKN